MPKVQADRFGVADVEIAVRLGGKRVWMAAYFPAAHIFRHDVANEIGRDVLSRRSHFGRQTLT